MERIVAAPRKGYAVRSGIHRMEQEGDDTRTEVFARPKTAVAQQIVLSRHTSQQVLCLRRTHSWFLVTEQEASRIACQQSSKQSDTGLGSPSSGLLSWPIGAVSHCRLLFFSPLVHSFHRFPCMAAPCQQRAVGPESRPTLPRGRAAGGCCLCRCG